GRALPAGLALATALAHAAAPRGHRGRTARPGLDRRSGPGAASIVPHRRGCPGGPGRLPLKSGTGPADQDDVSDAPQSVIPLLHALTSSNASDLHVKVGSPARLRVDGRLRRLQTPSLMPADTEHMVWEVVPESMRESFLRTHEADFAYSLPGVGRFRVNAYQARGTYGMVFRRVAHGAQTLPELALPEVVGELAAR